MRCQALPDREHSQLATGFLGDGQRDGLAAIEVTQNLPGWGVSCSQVGQWLRSASTSAGFDMQVTRITSVAAMNSAGSCDALYVTMV